ncbi:hypothetical protein Droror1_Dr00003732 [Drosera rotundifolia]
MRVTVLPSGLRVATEFNLTTQSVVIGVWIDAGSRYEADEKGIGLLSVRRRRRRPRRAGQAQASSRQAQAGRAPPRAVFVLAPATTPNERQQGISGQWAPIADRTGPTELDSV